MSDEPILKLEGITKQYPGTLAVDHVNLSIMSGEVHAIVGENGAGKSTLIKMLSGAVIPTSGTITYEGEAHDSFDPEEALDKGIAVIYQEFNLVPGLSIAANIFLGQRTPQRDFS